MLKTFDGKRLSCLNNAVFFTLFCCLIFSGSPASAGDLVFGFYPFANPSGVYRSFLPLARYLGKKTGREVRIRIAPDYKTHIKALRQGEVDLGFVGPSPYVQVKDGGGSIELLARFVMRDEITDRVVVICRADAPWRKITDLAGASFAFGDRQSFGSYFMPRHLLAERGIGLAALSAYGYLHSHDNVVLAVLHGDFAAGCVRVDVYNHYKGRALRIIAGPFVIPPHAIVCQTHLAPALRKRLRAALLSLRDPAVLQAINPLMERFSPVSDGDFDMARQVMGLID